MATSGMEGTEAFDRGGRLGLSAAASKGLALVFAVAALGSAGSSRAQAPVLPPPAYENSLQIGYFCLDDCTATDQSMQAKADMLRARVGEGPYLRLGIFATAAVDMPWPLPSDPALAQLTPDTETNLRAILGRAGRAGIGMNVSAMYGISRVVGFYDPAVTEDRRNAQWLSTGAPSWVTPSRYARRLRTHLETKVRAFTRLLATLRTEFPETFVSVAADGELELSSDGLDMNLPYEQQVLADYSPFAIAEFRDWVRNTGLYGPGGPFEGQGRAASGAKYRTGDEAADLAAFNADFFVPVSAGFLSWQLRYFDWNLSDPVNGDPNAIGPVETGTAGWDPRPPTGLHSLALGFDAPRAWNEGSPAFWNLWLEFRQALIANYVRDVATWMAGTVTPEGWSLSRDRIYTYQIPGDYLYGTFPGSPTPDRRLLTSASTLASADTGGIVSLGVTAFDEFCYSFEPGGCPVPPNVVGNFYLGTSDHLFPDIAARKPFNWGLVESNLSIPFSALETDPAVIAARISRGRDAGMHLYGYFPALYFDPTDSTALALLDGVGVFAQTAKSEPYDAALRNYAPPPVRGVTAALLPDRVGIAWTDTIFAESPGFRWADWGDFQLFEVYRASAPDAPPFSWQLAGRSTGNRVDLVLSSLSAANPWYFVRALSRKGLSGVATPVLAPCPFPGIPSVSVSSPFVRPGGPVTVTWQISNALSASFAGSAVPPGNGSRIVSPLQTTTYRLATSNGCGASEASVTVNVDPGRGPFAAPLITAPAAGQVLGLAGVTAVWNAMAGTTGYDLRLWDGKSGATVFTGSLVGSGSTSTLLTLPHTNGSYVAGVRACGGGAFTDAACGMFATRSFSVNLIVPTGAPTVTFPANGAILGASTQVLAWTAVTKADPTLTLGYEVLLTDIAGGNKPELQITVPDPGLSTIYSLHGSGQYELKVRACQAGCGPWSLPVTFAVSLPPVPTGAPGITGCSVSGGNSLTCDWNVVAGADLYQIYVVQPPPAGPGGGALTVAARVVSETTVTLPVPSGAANVIVAACNGDGCGPFGTPVPINPAGPNPTVASLGTPLGGSVVSGPTVMFSWNRVPGDNGSNTLYRLFVQDLSRQATALDVYTTQNFWAAYFKAEGARYDALVVTNPGPNQIVGPAQGFNVSGTSASAPTMVSPGHQSSVKAGNVQLGWSPVLGAGLYQYYLAAQVPGGPVVTGVTPGLVVQVPLGMVRGASTLYSGITRACPAGTPCTAASDAGWGQWSNVPGGPGVTNFTVTP